LKLNEKWTRNLFANLEEKVDGKTLEQVLLKCGRQCITESFKRRAKALRRKAKSDGEILRSLAKIWPALKLEKNAVFVVYPRCYCYIAGKFPGTLPKSYCNCSRGWIMELFETALGRSVKVEIIKTIKRGDSECRFRVKI
jgi:predicted hydrocarbon binding protein